MHADEKIRVAGWGERGQYSERSHAALAEVLDGLLQFVAGVHYEGTVAGDWFAQWFAGYQ